MFSLLSDVKLPPEAIKSPGGCWMTFPKLDSRTRSALQALAIAALITTVAWGEGLRTIPRTGAAAREVGARTTAAAFTAAAPTGSQPRSHAWSSVGVSARVAKASPPEGERRDAGRREGQQDAAERITITGGYVNDPGFTFCTAQPTADPTTFAGECDGLGAQWTGGITGHTLVRLAATVDIEGNATGTYDDWFYGVLRPDNTFGMLHFRGIFSVAGATGEFHAEAEIVDASCGFEGWSGSFVADGFAVHGGFIVEATRPVNPPAPDPTCNPVDAESLPLLWRAQVGP